MSTRETLKGQAREFQYHLVKTAIKLRGGSTQEDIAHFSGLSVRTVRRFEDRETKWPPKIEELLAAYAHVGGLGDNWDVWTTAANQAKREGLPTPIRSWQRGGGTAPDRLAEAEQEADALAHRLARGSKRSAKDSTSRDSAKTPRKRRTG